MTKHPNLLCPWSQPIPFHVTRCRDGKFSYPNAHDFVSAVKASFSMSEKAKYTWETLNPHAQLVFVSTGGVKDCYLVENVAPFGP
jgi:hypothetical protein